MPKIRLSILTLLFLIIVFSFIFLPNCILAQDPGPGPPGGSFQIPDPLGGQTIPQLITNIVNFIIVNIATPLAILMVIIAGFMFATAGGNEKKVTKAKRNLIWTLIGIAIVLASQMVAVYIQDLLTGSGGSLAALIGKLKTTINLVIGLLFAMALAFFCWGIVKYVGSGGDEEAITQGKTHMIWGIVGMSIMAAAAVIINMIAAYVS